MLDNAVLVAIIAFLLLGYAGVIAYSVTREEGGKSRRALDASLRRIRKDLGWIAAGARDVVAEALAHIAPYARSKTNIIQALQYAGIALAAPLSAADLESWSTRIWLFFAGLFFVAGVLFRGPKHEGQAEEAPPAQQQAGAPRTFG